MSGFPRLRVRDHVSHERLDGEVIAIDTRIGSYFNLGGTAADCWTLLLDGWPRETWLTILEMKYGPGLFCGIDDFVQQCLDFELVESMDPEVIGLARDPSSSALPDDQVRTAWASPEIVRFDDLQDLIKIDPIHDTSTFGWPSVEFDD